MKRNLHDNTFDFTQNAYRRILDTIEATGFDQNSDALLIFHQLEKNLITVPFCDYLKRYLYKTAALSKEFSLVSLAEYKETLVRSFEENRTQVSFEPSSTRISTAATNWLTQRKVQRSTVFLLGFGLRMTEDDVNDFLVKALHIQKIDENDPFELLCQYCYRNRYLYPHFALMWEYGKAILSGTADKEQPSPYLYRDDILFLKALPSVKENAQWMQNHTYRVFCALYEKTKVFAANERSAEQWDGKQTADMTEACSLTCTTEEITPAEIEKIFCSAIPTDQNGNPLANKYSRLREQLSGMQFTRKHISNLLSRKIPISRFDLITLGFFIYSKTTHEKMNAKEKYSSFLNFINAYLLDCGMGEYYVTTPYESFLLLCILSSDPIGTFSDVIEIAYSTEE